MQFCYDPTGRFEALKSQRAQFVSQILGGFKSTCSLCRVAAASLIQVPRSRSRGGVRTMQSTVRIPPLVRITLVAAVKSGPQSRIISFIALPAAQIHDQVAGPLADPFPGRGQPDAGMRRRRAACLITARA